MFERIVFPTDFSDYSEHAFHYALTIARETGADLHCLHILDQSLLKQPQVLGAEVSNDALQHADAHNMETIEEAIGVRLNELAGRAREAGVAAHVHSERGAPHRQILAVARRLGSDLIVMGTHGRSRADRVGIGGTYTKTMRSSEIPVLAIRLAEEEFVRMDTHEIQLNNVLCCCDLSELSQEAIPLAAGLCRTFGAQLTMAHVLHTREEYREFAPKADLEGSDLPATTEERLKSLAESHGCPNAIVAVREGSPAPALADLIEEGDYDLVVMSTHGRSGLVRGLLGSVTEKLFQWSPCPMLTIHPSEVAAAASR